MTLLSKKETSELPIRMLTLGQFSWIYPDKTCREHYWALREAIEAGLEVYAMCYEEYPGLKKVKKKRNKNHNN